MVNANGSTTSCRDRLNLAEKRKDDNNDEDGSDNSHPAMSIHDGKTEGFVGGMA
jgi:hypothetical protein